MIKFRKIRNIEGCVQQLWKNWRGTMGAAEEATKEGAQLVYEESQLLVPVDTEKLKKSGKVEKRKTTLGFKTSWLVTYDTDYAIYVHEDLSVYHDPPTTAKFLEIPLRNNQKLITKLVAARVQQKLEQINSRKKKR